jgi:hypothetical protein
LIEMKNAPMRPPRTPMIIAVGIKYRELTPVLY